MLNKEGRQTAPDSGATGAPAKRTFTANRGLEIEEALIFETGELTETGVDIDDPVAVEGRLGNQARRTAIDLPGLSEPQTLRHFVRLSQKNFAIDAGVYPLGSCTMKHNARLNEKMARLPGFADIHPLQPQSTVPGALRLIADLAEALKTITGMAAVAISPKAGAHGELCGMMAIKAALRDRGEADTRVKVLVPESAHGTNPATAALLGMEVVDVPARDDGTVSVEAVKELLADDVAAIMLTNPNTCGLFEPDVAAIADAVHEAGAYFYCDGANLNAIVGKVRPGDLGIDAMHINLHKTFSTPHGGGGPGAGPVVLSEALSRFAPLPWIRVDGDDVSLIEHEAAVEPGDQPFGRLTAFHGQMGMFVRAMAYILSHGADGMRRASEDAVLNANYVRAGLRDLFSQPFGDQVCMHEVLFDDDFLNGTGVSTLDFAKAMIDEGFHPMTMYFPLVVHGAMLVEPTESESKASLDLFIAALRDLAQSAKRGEVARFKSAPELAPRRRLDETRAARQPRLTWTPPQAVAEAAE